MFAETHAWVDSTTVLYWLEKKGKWSQYIGNTVAKIQDLETFVWHYVPTEQNPSDLGTRGIVPARIDHFWMKAPEWLGNVEEWPEKVEVKETAEAQTKALPRKEAALLQKQEDQNFQETWTEELLQKYKYWKLLRKVAKTRGPLTTFEIEQAEQWWIKLAQAGCEQRIDVPLKRDTLGIWRWYGRVPDYHPMFLPRKHRLTEGGRGTLPSDEFAWGSPVHNEQGAREVLDPTTATYY